MAFKVAKIVQHFMTFASFILNVSCLVEFYIHRFAFKMFTWVLFYFGIQKNLGETGFKKFLSHLLLLLFKWYACWLPTTPSVCSPISKRNNRKVDKLSPSHAIYWKTRVTCQMVEIHGWSLAWGNLSDGSFDKTRSVSILCIKEGLREGWK